MKRRIIEGVGSLFDALDKGFDAPFSGREVLERDTLLLPSIVRKELGSSTDGHISRDALGELVRNEAFLDQSIYLMMKILDTDPERQLQLLRSIASIEERNPDEIEPMHRILKEEFDALPEDASVQATKLAQVSRQGFNTWSDAYSDVAYQWDERYEDEPTPFLVGYATFGGLRKFLDAFRHDSRDLHLLIPNWIQNKDQEYCGYKVHTDADSVEVIPLPKDFDRPDNALILDDTIATGKGMRQLEVFWTDKAGATAPQADSIIVSPEHNK